MRIRQLTPKDVGQFVEHLWLPFAREMESTGEWNRLATDVDLDAEAREYRHQQLADDNVRTWIAVDDSSAGPTASPHREFAGYLAASYHESPPVFARGNRVHVDGLFVHEEYRGTGLASGLLDRARDWGVDRDCEELTLSVGAPNDRARAFYEREGFEVRRCRMACPIARDDAAERL